MFLSCVLAAWVILYAGEIRLFSVGTISDVPAIWRIVHQIPRDEGVVATFRFLPVLAAREELYAFHKIYSQDFQDSEKMREGAFFDGRGPFRLPRHIRYALIDLDDPWISVARQIEGEVVSERIQRFLDSPEWSVVDSAGTVLLMERPGPP